VKDSVQKETGENLEISGKRNYKKLNRSYITSFLLVFVWKMATAKGGVRLIADHAVAMSWQKQTTSPDKPHLCKTIS